MILLRHLQCHPQCQLPLPLLLPQQQQQQQLLLQLLLQHVQLQLPKVIMLNFPLKVCNIFFLAILVTGGMNHQTRIRTVEVLTTDGCAWCSLPDLPNDIYSHTLSGLSACGGRTCHTFRDGAWVKSHNMTQWRSSHTAWNSFTHGQIIMGGFGTASGNTSELLTNNGTTEPSFMLHHYTT